MDRRVYYRHRGGPKLLMVFLIVWSTPWLLIAAGVIPTHSSRVQGQASGTFPPLLFAFAGALFLAGTYLCLRVWNSRIELEGTRLRWFGWAGRCQGSADLGELTSVEDVEASLNLDVVRTVVTFEKAKLEFGNVGTQGYFEIRSRLMAAKRGEVYPADESIRPDRETVLLTPKIYRYRWSGLHGIALLLGLFSVASLFTPAFEVSLIIGAFALSIHLTCWNERIEVTPSEIVWIDWRNRPKATMLVDEIFGVAGVHTGGGAYHIDGSIGFIAFSAYLNDSAGLIKQIESLPPYHFVQKS